MYTLEQKQLAVDTYIKMRSLRKTIQCLGYPGVTDTPICRQTAMLYCRYLATESVTTSKYFQKAIFIVFGKEITPDYLLAEDSETVASGFTDVHIIL